MDTEMLFKIFNTVAIVPWIWLICLPKFKGTQWMMKSQFFPFVLAVCYLVMMVVSISQMDGGTAIDFSTLEGLMAMFTNPMAVLVGWIHYLCFDLFVGTWVLKDSQERDLSHWFMIPILLFCLMAGPFGFMLYYLLRALKKPKNADLTTSYD